MAYPRKPRRSALDWDLDTLLCRLPDTPNDPCEVIKDLFAEVETAHSLALLAAEELEWVGQWELDKLGNLPANVRKGATGRLIQSRHEICD